jgi:hypothetical protein
VVYGGVGILDSGSGQPGSGDKDATERAHQLDMPGVAGRGVSQSPLHQVLRPVEWGALLGLAGVLGQHGGHVDEHDRGLGIGYLHMLDHLLHRLHRLLQ